ncbi:MAG: hypothetical protein Q9186_005668 [Xanthomendoza sp. 1 TL-2023]
MSLLLSVPDEILILICQNLTIPSIFTVRLVCSHIANLVLNYSQAIVPEVAHTTFPDARLLLRVPSGQYRDFAWLKGLIHRYLAAVLVDRFKLSSTRLFFEPHGIPAESDIGEALRSRVENGWHVFQNLGKLTEDAQYLPYKYQSSVSIRDRLRHGAYSRHKRDRLAEKKAYDGLEHRITKCVNEWPRTSLEDYQLTTFLLHLAFRTKHDQPEARSLPTHRISYDGPDDFDWNAKEGILLENYNSWANWAILPLGSPTFFRQWSPISEEPKSCLIKDSLLRMWKSTTPEEVKFLRRVAVTIRDTMRRNGIHEGSWEQLLDGCQKYKAWELGLGRFLAGEPLPLDWMDQMPYFVDFTSSCRTNTENL